MKNKPTARFTDSDIDGIIEDMQLPTRRELTDLEFESIVCRCASFKVAQLVADRVELLSKSAKKKV